MTTPDITGNAGMEELTRQVIDNAYAKFCAEQRMRPSALAAKRFAVSVTESGAKPFHGVTSDTLVKMLVREFPQRKPRRH